MRGKDMKSVNLLCYLMVCLLVVLMTAKPILNTLAHIADSKYELVDLHAGEDSKGKEMAEVDDDHKELKLFAPNMIDQKFFNKTAHTFFNFQIRFSDFNPDILFPPPRNSNNYRSILSWVI